MLRTFDEHEIRANASIGGRWELQIASERTDRGKLPKSYNRSIHIPNAWVNLPDLRDYRGKAWLRTHIATAEAGAVRLVFGGVSHTASVYVNGTQYGSHYDAFTPFEIIVPDLDAGVHEVVVEVDNSFGDHSALHIENDYYTYGGITRPVMMQLLPVVSIAHLKTTPIRKKNGKWALDVEIGIRRLAPSPEAHGLRLEIAGNTYELGEIGESDEAVETLSGRLDNLDVAAWSPETPRLYEASVQLYEVELNLPVDDYIGRVGFREIKVKGKKLLLNGESIRLRGYNRHEDHPHYGCAIPLEAMLHDLEIMRDLGCNFVRTCHYPNDMRFLDLCDELGFYVWEESHARTVDFQHPAFTEQIENSTLEMLHWHHNHPSIIIWGVLNECESETESGREVHRHCLQLLRDIDGSRPISFASNRQKTDICLDLVDIVSWNLYPGWYNGGIDNVEPFFADMYKWLQTPESGGKGKPVIMSEFGGGAVYGNHEPEGAKWSETYQADLLAECLRIYLHHPGIVGAAIWQFSDCRVTKGWSMQWPNSINNKGTVDRYRRPKLSYAAVKEAMHAAAEKWDGA